MKMEVLYVYTLLGLLGPIGTHAALYFEEGHDYHYTYSAESDLLGMHNITTIMKFRVRYINQTGGISLNQLLVDSFVQHSEKGYLSDNPFKWDLGKTFLFIVSEDGIVTLVHFHPDEKDEVLSLKKVLASTLSAKVKMFAGSLASFVSNEIDHTGHLEHLYTGRRTYDGLEVTRFHQSTQNVHRLHRKVIHFDQAGTPYHVEGFDNVTLQRSPSAIRSSAPIEGEKLIEDSSSGDVPQITSVSRTSVKLTAKRRHNGVISVKENLSQDQLIIKEKVPVPLRLVDVKEKIQQKIDCIHAIANKHDRNRTECVQSLRSILDSLLKEDYLAFTRTALQHQCKENDTVCQDERNLYIDLVARKGDRESQLLLLETMLANTTATEEEIRRCLFHCIALKEPELRFVEAVEKLCFGHNDEYHGSTGLGKNQKRACLSLGAMARSLQTVNNTEAERLVHKLESWLQHHNESKTIRIIKPRLKRSILEYDQRSRKHIETKMVLLQALGNAALNRSLPHIQSYMQGNVHVTAWRRAAVHGLRHFTCNESASALLTSAVNGDDHNVRDAAVKVYSQHPKGFRLTTEEENIVLRKNYTYPVVARVRRGIKDLLRDGIGFTLKPPGIEWAKVIGTKDIGASFGLIIRNIMDLHLGLLDGHFIIDVYDKAWAEAHVGLIGLQIDIVKAFLCYKGHIEYDLNVLKDFGINSLSDLVHIYDKVVAKIVDPINNAVQSFRDIVTAFKDRGIQGVFNGMVTVVKNLPDLLGDMTSRMADFVREIMDFSGVPWVEDIKRIVQKLRNFVETIKRDVLNFYHSVVDAVTIGLPYIGTKIRNAFNLIVTAFRHILENPMDVITGMSRAVMQLKMAVTMVADVKTNIVEACLFLKGKVPEWMNSVKKLPAMLKEIKEIFEKFTSNVLRMGDDAVSATTDGMSETAVALRRLQNDLKSRWNRIFAPLYKIMNFAKPFIEEFKAITDLIKGIKFGYKTIKNVIQVSKSLVQKVFGPKFDRGFPTKRREKDDSCEAGTWPTTSDDRFKTTGVDIILGKGQSIKCPVNGLVKKRISNSVLVMPGQGDFEGMEVIIHNIKPDRKVTSKGTFFKAGQKIGKATKSSCKKNFIHLAMRKKENSTKDDADYEYVDPSPYLDRLVPIPKWIQECNDHEFRHIGQIFDSGETTEGEPEEASEKIKRSMQDSMDDFKNDFENNKDHEEPPYRPEGLYDDTSFGDSLKNSLKQQTKAFMDAFMGDLFADVKKVPSILDMVNVNGMTMDRIKETIKDDIKLLGK